LQEPLVTEGIGFRAGKQVGSGTALSRRDLLALIGTLAGSAAMYHAMSSLGFASDSTYKGPLNFLDVVTLVTGAFFLPWFCHLLSFCRHRTDLARFLRMVH
jgi:hypothetical protein